MSVLCEARYFDSMYQIGISFLTNKYMDLTNTLMKITKAMVSSSNIISTYVVPWALVKLFLPLLVVRASFVINKTKEHYLAIISFCGHPPSFGFLTQITIRIIPTTLCLSREIACSVSNNIPRCIYIIRQPIYTEISDIEFAFHVNPLMSLGNHRAIYQMEVHVI